MAAMSHRPHAAPSAIPAASSAVARGSRSPAPPTAPGSPWTDFWPLEAGIDFLNHGSFGSVPHPIRDAQRAWRDRIEARPIEMLGRRWRELLAPVRERLARFVGVDGAGLGFVANATEGVNSVLRSLRLAPGDVVLTTDHVYNAVRQTIRHLARRAGAELRIVPLAAPAECERGPDPAAAMVERVAAAIDGRVRIAVFDHVTSPTALCLPVAALARLCRERGVFCLVDGAHAPGMLPLDVGGIGADAYTGNLHKWVCAPKGSAFLWVAPQHRDAVHPATISHFLDEGFTAEFDWQGTRDLSPWLAIGDALELWGSFGWERLRDHNATLRRHAAQMLAERWNETPLAVECDSLADQRWCSMATVPIPRRIAAAFSSPEAMQARLYERDAIEVPVVEWAGRRFVRVSCQLYNRPEQYERLAEAVLRLGSP